MGQYKDFDLDIKKVQEQNNNTNQDVVQEAATASCGWLTTSCSAHCR